jgi:hypothetical protein
VPCAGQNKTIYKDTCSSTCAPAAAPHWLMFLKSVVFENYLEIKLGVNN